MPETLSADIRTGYSPQVAFDIKLDTFNRMQEVFNRPSKAFGIDYYDPLSRVGSAQQQTQGAIAPAPAPPMDFKTALLSNDPKMRDMALDVLDKSASSDPYARLNVGKEYRTTYDRNTAKFIDDKFGYDMFSDNEDFYYRNSYLDDGWFARAVKNVGRFAGRVVVGTATKFLEGAGYLGSMVTNGVIDGAKALGGQEVHYWEDVADNAFSKVMKNANDDFRDYVLPVYKQAGFDEKGFFSQLGNYAFWNDSFADGVAFFASAFIPAGIASKTGLLAKGVTLGAQIGEDASVLARVGAGARTALRAATGAETYGEAGLAIFNTANEAAFQATGQYTETKQQLLDARERGENKYTDKQIQDLSGKAAASSFGWNFPALMVSNAWEMKNVLMPILGRGKNAALNSERAIVEETGKLGFKPYKSKFLGKIAESRLGKVARFYTPIAAKGTMIEGFWEENIQNAIDRAARGSYARYGDDTDKAGVVEKAHGGFFGILEQYVKQTIDALKGNDRENSLAIGTGALIGLAGGIGGAKFGRRINPITGKTSFRLGERRQEQLALDAVFAETNNAYNNFLSIQDVKKEDGTIDETKLADKVAAFENFTSRQRLLDDLKEKKQFKPEELEALQNSLLNQYVKGLAKVDKVQDAVKRIQDLANRDVEAKGEKFIANPVQVSQYLTQVAEDYARVQAKADHISSKYTPSQMQEINTTIKDRAFDLIAERRAIQPILKNYEAQVQTKLNTILDFLQNNPGLPQGEYIQQGLARNRATDYIQALAKKEVFTNLLDKDAPEFLKDYHRARIKEADDAIESYNKELGANAPEIKDGEITFNDKVIDFKGDLLKSLLQGYKNAYGDQADVEFMQQHNEHIADSIQDPVNGLQNWNDYKDYIQREIERANIPTKQSFTVGDKTYDGIQALDKALADKEITQVQYDDAINAATNQAPVGEETLTPTEEITPVTEEDPLVTTEETSITDPVKTVKEDTDSIDPDKPLSWVTPNKKSIDDTEEINKETEQLKDVPYAQALQLINELHISNLEETNNKYKFFIVKDTFPQVYTSPADNIQKDVVPTGEVIIMKDLNGKHLTIGELLPSKFKDLADLPVVFSFEQSIFRGIQVPDREVIWEKKNNAKPGEAAIFYQAELDRNTAARKFVRENEGAEVQIIPIHSNEEGIMPTTKNVVPVIQRFGDEFTVDVKTVATTKFDKGTITATFGNVSFPIGTAKLSSSGTELAKVEKILAKQFDTKQRAEEVRNRYLSVMFYTDENQNFGIKQVGDKHQIYFRKIDDRDRGLDPKDKINFLKPSVDYGNLRFHASAKSLKNGLNIYNPDTDIFEPMTADEYQAFIKTKAVTNLKKTLDVEGNLYMKPVNAYFSFTIDESQLQKEKPKEKKESTYNKVVARIAQLIKDKGVTKENIASIKKGIQESLKQKLISQAEFTKLNERLTELEAEAKKKSSAAPKAAPVAKPTLDIEAKKADIERRRKERLSSIYQETEDNAFAGKGEWSSKSPKNEIKGTTENILWGFDTKEKLVEAINAKYDAELAALEGKKTETKLPTPKTEQEEEDEEEAFKKKKAKERAKKKEKTDINQVLGNVPSKADTVEYKVALANNTYVLNQTSGSIAEQKNRISVARGAPTLPKILAEMAKNYPFAKGKDGSISGVFTAQLEGKDGTTFTAYGLPSERNNEFYVDDKGKVVTSPTVETSHVELLKTLLTDNGKAQLEDFLKRNC